MLQKSVFIVKKMDCPCEEELIRLHLGGLEQVEQLAFDLPARTLTVYHTGAMDEIAAALAGLKLDEHHVRSEQVGAVSQVVQERRYLWAVLAINFFFFMGEGLAGLWAESMGLLGDALDMLADSMVYGLALFAVGGPLLRKKRIARASGYIQALLALWGFAEVLRRFVGVEEMPQFAVMMGMSFLALIGNAACLYILQKSRSQEIHMRASMIFTANDVLVNIGVMAAGALVWLTGTRYPDLVIGALVFVLVLSGAFRILKLGK